MNYGGYEYSQGHLTPTGLLELMEDIFEAQEEKALALLWMFDLDKAFDCIQ